MRIAAAALLLAAACGPACAQATLPASALDSFPHVDIGNGMVSAKVFPPGDRELYRGTRFDHAGVVNHITYKGQDYGQYWFDRFATDPQDSSDLGRGVQRACCATSGPVEEFEQVGFDEAGPCREAAQEKTCGRFLKIGVGILRRDTETYDRFHTYPILDQGKRTTSTTPTSVRFTQDIHDDASGYGYAYSKTVRLAAGKPQLLIEAVLRNTGTKPIVTTVYNHNFLTLDPGNAHIEITAPFAIATEQPLQPALARVEGKSIRYLAALKPGETVASAVTGFGANAGDYDFRIRNTATGFGQRMRADQSMSRIYLWSIHTVLGWEPYIAISLRPGETRRWTYTYDFFGPGEN